MQDGSGEADNLHIANAAFKVHVDTCCDYGFLEL